MNLSDLFSKAVLGGLCCFGFAAADSFDFHRFEPIVELTIFYAGLGALGIGGAFSAGVRVPSPVAPQATVSTGGATNIRS